MVAHQGPEVEQHAGEKDARDEDVEDAATAWDDIGGYDAAGDANGVEGHDQVEGLLGWDVDDFSAEDGDL